MSTITSSATTRPTTRTWKLFVPPATTLANECVSEPLRWRKPQRVGINGDLFHEDVPDEFIDQVFAVMALCPQHVFQVLTKRPERRREYMTKPFASNCFRDDHLLAASDHRITGVILDLVKTVDPRVFNAAAAWNDARYPDSDTFTPVWPLPNVWMGVSAEDQQRWDERVPVLLETPAAVRFVSAEPLLEPIDAWRELHDSDCVTAQEVDGRLGCICNEPREDHISWVIVGGESGPHARPCNVGWIRGIVAQCKAAGVAVFVKQLGAKPVERQHKGGCAAFDSYLSCDCGKPSAGIKLRDRHGGDPDEWPEDLRVREFPS